MPKRSPIKRVGRPLPYSRPSTTAPTPPQPHDGANNVSAIDPSITNEERSDLTPNGSSISPSSSSNTTNTATSVANPSNHSSTSPASSSNTTSTTTPASAATSSAPSSSPGTDQRPNFNTWHPVTVLHAFNASYVHATMPADHEMVRELRQDPLPENLRMENELRILALDALWKKQETRLQGPDRNGPPEGSGDEGRVDGGGQ